MVGLVGGGKLLVEGLVMAGCLQAFLRSLSMYPIEVRSRLTNRLGTRCQWTMLPYLKTRKPTLLGYDSAKRASAPNRGRPVPGTPYMHDPILDLILTLGTMLSLEHFLRKCNFHPSSLN